MMNRRNFLSFLAVATATPKSLMKEGLDAAVTLAPEENIPELQAIISSRDIQRMAANHFHAKDSIEIASRFYSNYTIGAEGANDPYLEEPRRMAFDRLESHLKVFIKEDMGNLAKLRQAYKHAASLVGQTKLEDEIARLEVFKGASYNNSCREIIQLLPEDSKARQKAEEAWASQNSATNKKVASDVEWAAHLSGDVIDKVYAVSRVTEDKINEEIAVTEKRLQLPKGSLAILLEAGDRSQLFEDGSKSLTSKLKDDELFTSLGSSFTVPAETHQFARDEIEAVIRRIYAEAFAEAFPDVKLEQKYMPPTSKPVAISSEKAGAGLIDKQAPEHEAPTNDQHRGIPASSLARVIASTGSLFKKTYAKVPATAEKQPPKNMQATDSMPALEHSEPIIDFTAATQVKDVARVSAVRGKS